MRSNNRAGNLVFWTVLLGICVTAVRADDDRQFTSSKSFSLHYPAGWMVASKDQTDQVANIVRPYLEKLGSVNLDQMAVLIFNPGDPDFTPNLNVVVTSGSGSLNEDAKAQFREVVNQIAAKLGAQTEDVRVTIETFGENKAVAARYNLLMKGRDLSQMIAAFPGQNQTYVVTCTASRDNFSHYEPIFTSMLNTMQIDTGLSGIPSWGKSALIGAGIGALIGLIKWAKSAMGKRKTQTA